MLLLFRIGGKPVLVALLFMLVLFFSACSDSSENELAVFKALDESLVNSNLTLTRSSQTIYMSLEEKTRDPVTSQKAMIWLPKAMVVKKYSDDIIAFIENLKVDLKKEAGFKKVAGKELFNENDMKAVNVLFNEKGMGKEVHHKLKEFRRDILSIDIQMDSAFRSTLLLKTLSSDISGKQQDSSANIFPDKISVIGALAMLDKFKNDILVAENRLAMFCNTRFTDHRGNYTSYSAIIAQSVNWVKAGEEVEIYAGIGSFTLEDKLNVIVNGKSVTIGDDAVAIYKFKASGKAGKHIIPVEISYFDQKGEKQVITKDVEYTVIK